MLKTLSKWLKPDYDKNPFIDPEKEKHLMREKYIEKPPTTLTAINFQFYPSPSGMCIKIPAYNKESE